jgi:hypothetical protein
VRYRYRETYYQIEVRRTKVEPGRALDVPSVTLDGVAQEVQFIQLADDRKEHRVEVLVALP